MSWDFSKPIPIELRDETPFNCPSCNHTMSVKDKGFQKHIVDMMYAD